MDSLIEKIPNGRLYIKMAKQFVCDVNLWEDAVQEAAIAVWRKQEEDKRNGVIHNNQWYNGVARTRIRTFNTRQDTLEPIPSRCGKPLPNGGVCTRVESHPSKCRRDNNPHSVARRPNGFSKDPLKQPHDSYDQKYLGWQQDSWMAM